MSQAPSAVAKISVKSLLDEYLFATKSPPKKGSKQLYINSMACGWVHPDAVLALKGTKSIVISDSTVNIIAPAEHGILNKVLAEAALRLFEAGCCVSWRNELLDVWAEDLSIAAIERGVVRPLGITTRAVHLHARSHTGALWVARRALNKATDPGLWDTLVGGLVGYGEPDDLALVRETDEEAGLSPNQIENRTPIRQLTVMQRQLPEGYQVEKVLTSECVLLEDCVPANKDGEVMHIQCIEPGQVIEMLLAKAFTIEATIVIAEDLVRRG